VACCVAFDIGALEKPTATPCRHLAVAGGCAIYAERPDVCRHFECGWVRDEGGGGTDDERPDRLDVVVAPADPDCDFTRATGVPLLVAYELRPDALDSCHSGRLLERLARKRLVGLLRFGWDCGDREPAKFVGPPELLRVSGSWVAERT
jgi:hypothetical protein